MIMKKNVKHYVILILVIITLVSAGIILLNPLRQSEADLRERMLKITPIGTNMKEVVKVIKENKKWELEWVDNESGYGIDKASGEPGEEYDFEIGKKSIRICIGTYSYRIIFPVQVLVYYGFDEKSKLIDVAVRKDVDTL